MIIRSLLAALLGLVAFHLCYPVLPKKFNRIAGQQRCNLARAERFVYGTHTNTGVIIGSSMSLRLDDGLLGQEWQKLTLPGCGILTGLELLRRSGKSPELLLIECNQCAWDANEDILNHAFNPLLDLPRRHSRIFFEEARPSNFVTGLTEACLGRILGMGSRPPELTAEQYGQVLDATRRQMDLELPLGPLHRRVAEVGEYVDYFQRQGALCFLYLMPTDPSLRDLKSPMLVRREIQSRFPDDQYYWITFDERLHYETSDGLHLTRESARRLTAELLRQVEGTIAADSQPYMHSGVERPRAFGSSIDADPQTHSDRLN